MPNLHSLILSFYVKRQNRQTIHKGQRGRREASGTSAGRAAEAVQDPPAGEPPAFRLSPGPPDGAEDIQPPPRRDADVLAGQ